MVWCDVVWPPPHLGDEPRGDVFRHEPIGGGGGGGGVVVVVGE